MTQDLVRLLEFLKINQCVLIGHSMGGLTSMRFTLLYPEKVLGLVVVDIAPRPYFISYEAEFSALSVDLSPYHSRKEIDMALSQIIPRSDIRQFLQTNIERGEDGHFYWRLNVEALKKAPNRADPELPTHLVVTKKVVFFRSLHEDFITEKDIPLIYHFFPRAEIIDFHEGNHWLHITEQEKFLQETRRYLLQI